MTNAKKPAAADTAPPDTAAAEPVRTAGPASVESLDELAAMARTLETPAAPVVDPAAAAEAERRARDAEIAATAKDFGELLQVVRDSVAPMVEGSGVLRPGQVAEIWTNKALDRIAYPLAALAQRHGLNANAVMEQYGPWLMLAAGLGLPGLATFKAIKENRQAQAAPAAS